MSNSVIPLTEAGAADLPLVGGKGAQLGSMLQAGLPVPAGFCVSTEAFRRGMDDGLRQSIVAAYEHAASPGVVRGPARILFDPADGALLQRGDILVAKFTDPGWTPLFLTAGGLVMEVGGIVSHGAVVAREYGIPAVIGVKHVTRMLRDGEVIEVDGGTGEVRRLQEGIGVRMAGAAAGKPTA